MTTTGTQIDPVELFAGDSEMARRCRALDWTATTLGPPERWPLALRAAVRMALECPFPIALWCGPALAFLYNDAYTVVLGAKHPHALGRPGAAVWAEIWPEIAPWFASMSAGGPAVYAEDARFLMERAEGPPSQAWFTFSLSPVRDDGGQIVGYLNVASETTQRLAVEGEMERARAAAERAERQLREVFAQTPAFLAVLRGPDHVFEFANDAYMRMVGQRDLIGRSVAEAIPEVREQGFVALLDEVLRSGAPFIGRELPVALARAANAAPEQRLVDFVYQPVCDETGAPVGIVAHGSDVTDAVAARREIERLLRVSEAARADAEASEARYRFLANAIPVQVWTARPDGALDYVSQRAARYFGKTPEQVIGEGWLAVLHPDDVPSTVERWTSAIATGERYEIEFRLWSAEHEAFRWHLARATAQRDDDGAILGWFGTNTDIEDWKRAEAELKRLTVEATEADRAKSDFLAAMSHELRTPLNAIGGYAQLIEIGVRGPVTDEQRVDLLKIQRSKNHLDNLVSEVLSFAKLGAGRLDFRVREVRVAGLLDAVAEMVAPQAAQKRLHLEWGSLDADAYVLADEDKTRQILLNLLANALKFTPADGTISVGVAVGDGDVAITVADTGIGVPRDQVERIFEPFAQARRALVPSDHGVGLGLAISRQLARAMNGDLTLESVVGRGSAFTVRLPRAGGAPRSPQPPSP